LREVFEVLGSDKNKIEAFDLEGKKKIQINKEDIFFLF
jgi:hypothetical protein